MAGRTDKDSWSNALSQVSSIFLTWHAGQTDTCIAGRTGNRTDGSVAHPVEHNLEWELEHMVLWVQH
jgi:hypothetical protein